ncbi:hypothetical protein [Micrococcus luteus]|uniref:hypothetical protein n=1 Tax=Micrococcus luteus TaxID=1270 RepID=UPI0033E9E937
MTLALMVMTGSLLFALVFWNRPVIVLTAVVAVRILVPGMAEGFLTPYFHPAMYLLMAHVAVQAVFAWPRLRRALRLPIPLVLLVLFLAGWMLLNSLADYGGGLLDGALSLVRLLALPLLLFLLIRDEVGIRPRSERMLVWTLHVLGVAQVVLGQMQMNVNEALVYENLYRQAWWWDEYVYRALGTVGHGIQLGFFLAALIFLTLRLRQVSLRIVLSCVYLYGILLAEARLALIFALIASVIVLTASLFHRPVATLVWAAIAGSAAVPAILVSEAYVSVLTKFEDDQGSNELRLQAFQWAGEHFREFLWTGYAGTHDLSGAGLIGSSLENGYLIFGLSYGLFAAAVLALVHVTLAVGPVVARRQGSVALPASLAAILTIGAFFGSSSFMAQALEGITVYVFAALGWTGSYRWQSPRAVEGVATTEATSGTAFCPEHAPFGGGEPSAVRMSRPSAV